MVRLQRAERTRCAGHGAAAYDTMSCYCWYSGNLERYRMFWARLSVCPHVLRISNKFLERVWVRFGLRENWVRLKRGMCQAILTSLKYVILLNRAPLNRDHHCSGTCLAGTTSSGGVNGEWGNTFSCFQLTTSSRGSSSGNCYRTRLVLIIAERDEHKLRSFPLGIAHDEQLGVILAPQGSTFRLCAIP